MNVIVREMVEKVDDVVSQAVRLTVERIGGYFCLANKNSGLPVMVFPVGKFHMLSEKTREKYCAFSQEKALRLAENPLHQSSWQSRNESKMKYGGAVRGRTFIFSFSGLPEKLDEAAMLTLAVEAGDLDHSSAFAIAQTNGNEFFTQVYNLVFIEERYREKAENIL